jgi:hypothetical protein
VGAIGFGGATVVSSLKDVTQAYYPRSGGLALGSSKNPGSMTLVLNENYHAYKVEVVFNDAGTGNNTIGLSGNKPQKSAKNGSIGTEHSNPSTGSGLLALRAYDLLNEGKTLDETADYLEKIAPKSRSQFIVDNLEMLAAGGRVTGIKLFFGRILRAHPFLQVNNDKLEVVATPKGKSERALDLMLQVAREEISAGLESPRVFITHSHGGERIDYLYDRLKEFVDPKNILISEAGAVISSHCGAGTIGILYIRK